MRTSRRDTLKLALLASAQATMGGVQAFAAERAPAYPAAGDSVRPPGQPRWAHGHDGQRKPDLGDGRYLNPIIPGAAPDPDIVKDGADYYMTFSSFEEYPGLPLYHSQDLVNWVRIGSAVAKPFGSIIAPSIKKHQGRFFIYFPGGLAPPAGKGRGTYVVWADDVRGPWSEPALVQAGGGIDPGHVVGEDGKRYLFLSGGTRVRLTDDGLKADGPIEKVYAGWQYPEDWYDEGFSLESPKLFRRGEYFYLVCAEGGTYGPPTSHMATVARSKSINGPWENDPGNPLIHTRTAADPWWSRGHGVIVEGPAGDWWIVYHAYENGYRTLGRQTLLEPIRWTADGWPRAVATDLSKPLPSPRGGHNLGSGQPLSDDFSSNRLGTLWRFYRPGPDETQRAVFGDRSLTLQGKGSSFADCSPLTCIPADRAYEISVEAELLDQVEAGLMLFIGSTLYAGVGHDGARVKSYNKGGPARGQSEPTPTRRIWVRIVNDHQVMSMFTSPDGRNWVRYPLRLDVSGYHQNVAPGGAESLRIGLYAIGAGRARFRNFSYRALA